ncbi:MAG: GyrI-like domain-containing protein [Thermoleophilia bacterium]
MSTAARIDLIRELKGLYKPSAKKPAIVDVPGMNFLMVDGVGDPNDNQFQEACNALYGMSYTLKFMLKKHGRPDYRVMPLEGLWWMAGTRDFDMSRRDEWKWRAMIVQPDPVTADDVKQTRAELREKKDPRALPKVKFKDFAEAKAVQIMYIGPYSEEGPTIQMLHQFAADSGFKLAGKHHEIYLGDPRRSAPEKLKTIIRQPVK